MLSYTPQRWCALAYLGVVASGAGFYLWNTGAARVKAGELAVMNNLKSPLAVLVSIIFWKAGAIMSASDWAFLAAGAALIAASAAAARRLPSAENA